MRPHAVALAGLVVLASLVFAGGAEAQILGRWFGPKSADQKEPASSPKPDPRRAAEINVEIAWLADSVTFPYYLEARAGDAKLEVRGYVPNKAVRERALRIAQVYSSLPVMDAMREHPSLYVKASQMSGQQLRKSVASSLRVALPKQYQQLQIECGADGKVYVSGVVQTADERMAVSNALRRLHGCTSVQNLTALPDETREPAPIVNVSRPAEPRDEKPVVAQASRPRSWLSWPFNKVRATTDEPPLLDPDELAQLGMIRQLADLQKPAAGKQTSPAPTVLSATEMRKRIHAAWPKAKSVHVEFAGKNDVRITLELRAETEVSAAAECVFALPELQNYRPQLQFKFATP